MASDDDVSTARLHPNEDLSAPEWVPVNAGRITLICVLAQAATGYGSSIVGTIPTEIKLPANVLWNSPGALIAIEYVYTFGLIAGAILVILLSGLLGRKKSVGLGLLLATVACIIQTTSFRAAQSITSQALAGIGSDFVTIAGPVWQIEVSTTRRRGTLVLTQVVARLIGSVVAGWIALSSSETYYFPDLWRLLVALQLLLLIASLAIFPAAPDSRRPAFEERFANRQTNHYEYQQQSNKQIYRRAALGVLLMLFAALSGTALIQYFVNHMIEATGYGPLGAYLVSAGSLTYFALCCGVSIAVVERIGRCTALQIAFVGQAVTLIPVTVILAVGVTGFTGPLVAFEIFAFLFLGFAGFGYGFMWVYVAEINTWALRVAGVALAVILNELVSFGMNFAYVLLVLHTGWPAVFIAVSVLAAFAIFFMFPETAGRSLESIDRYFEHTLSVTLFRDKRAARAKGSYADENFALR